MLESSPAPALGWRSVPPVVSQLTEICPVFFPRILRPSIWFHLGGWFAKTNRPLKRAWAAMALGGGVTLSLRISAELFPWQFCVLPKKQRTKKSRTHRHSDDNGWSTKSRDIGVSYILKWWSSSIFKFPHLQPKLVSPSRACFLSRQRC